MGHNWAADVARSGAGVLGRVPATLAAVRAVAEAAREAGMAVAGAVQGTAAAEAWAVAWAVAGTGSGRGQLGVRWAGSGGEGWRDKPECPGALLAVVMMGALAPVAVAAGAGADIMLPLLLMKVKSGRKRVATRSLSTTKEVDPCLPA